ncbi:aminotransferase class I/II-fold pyridoxal phosphate-dependent enzyme [Poseidonibacter ostreae]|uniref:Aminotransferase class I/II-fold pyridoxal phosphate-dependent enzyme n=2 Tax=Poseidonibacter ostreae TaxID=2654171 RepID=A0A6L4WQ48_9BACT|nr:aminotransferase class I/II-fold pyridoxal phosphate-dependent enzyme [Poseidonibacter ostreae]KAB7882986.1 aminotransferase class I/II-fold pyridoxal phosphate-dependent enzyme [Poseidonibacter ostreae]KAB7886636.1 aminotransferase class I/II-fold pyridoxal phosphate-dependent enzyme [Poseidonibacter ostreae]KAB7889246.1 aminotransferase class I/II-fold pyridoxal phosphate-dependent enzyme [Poseidonibacter ostreae]MAC82637.1 aminotransferase [Arcobacter sp.]
MRYDDISSFIVMDIVRDAQKYEDSIHFEIGQPDLKPSLKVKKALQKAVDEDKFSYTESLGLLSLREKISLMYKENYNVDIEPSRILLTPGTSGAFLVAYTLTLKHKENLGLSDPSYPCYKNFANMLDINPSFMNIDKSTNYELTTKHLEKEDIQALQISSPSNPTGNLYSKENLKELVEYCKEKDIAFISDELYHGLTYEEDAHTALEFSDDVFVINGFSKYYCMPGMRLGWIIVPKSLSREAEKIAQNIFISAPTLSQYAALEAFDKEYLSEVKNIFKERRDYLYNELSTIFNIDAKPDGAFYLWANVSKYTDDSFAFAKELLENIHVATTPGVDFGSNKTEQYLRFAYTRDIEHMSDGIKRLKKYLNDRK